jgi:hypothetical protein
MTLEEMAIDPPTNLGLKLKIAKASGDPNWLTPQLLSAVLEGGISARNRGKTTI